QKKAKIEAIVEKAILTLSNKVKDTVRSKIGISSTRQDDGSCETDSETEVIRYGDEDYDRTEVIEEMMVELIDELKDAKKVFRKQGILLEVYKQEIIERIDKKASKDIDIRPYLELSDNFFYLITSFKEQKDISYGLIEAIEIVWQKMEQVLLLMDIAIIRQEGLPFDPKIHESVDNISIQGDNLIVVKVLQPGFIYMGNIIRAAKVIIGDD
ncbi:MAG: nucleotide exchange factor GrpE, partial [Candidatus Magnetoovum sp. WYHC-5]|nr:nucleotide exchange factor GrpE [Candidatus Magnetoovum sp. WYHC-5]